MTCGNTGLITDIKRFEIHDGRGLRTTVFFSGCPLRCKWCHNPETLSGKPVLLCNRDLCVGCHLCKGSCSNGALIDSAVSFDRIKCVACGKCADMCPNNALRLYGKRYTVSELLPRILEDRMFYMPGGATLSGGEPLLQVDFAVELLKALKQEGIDTAVDTCGCIPWTHFEKVLPYVDTFLFDIKAISPEVHKQCTGRSNELILSNFERLYQTNVEIEVRVPFVPGENAGEMEKIAAYLSSHPRVSVKVLSYHAYAQEKYEGLDLPFADYIAVPDKEQIETVRALFCSKGVHVIQ